MTTAERYRELADRVDGLSASLRKDGLVAVAGEYDATATALREAAEMREALEQIAGVTIIPEDSQVRPGALSYKTPSEFHVFAQVVARSILGTNGGGE